MFAAREDGALPNLYSAALLCLRDRRPFTSSVEEIAETAAEITDPNFRIEVSEDGIHCYNRAGHQIAQDAFAHYPKLAVETDGSHAFYLGYELARAEMAWRLGKRYVQDQPIDWGAAVEKEQEDLLHLKEAGETLKAAKAARRRKSSRRGKGS